MLNSLRAVNNPRRFSLSEQLVFYGSYHSHPINLLTHFIFVPLIAWSTQVLLAALPVPKIFKGIAYTYVFNEYLVLKPSWAALQSIYYYIYYSALDPFAALTMLPIVLSILLSATAFTEHYHAVAIAVILNIISWVAQILAHKYAEKRAPALTENLAAAFILAPFFLHLEGLFALGYRPTLRYSVEKEINAELKRHHGTHTGRHIKSKK